MKKKLRVGMAAALSLTLASAMLSSTAMAQTDATVVQQQAFTDLSGHWAKQDIERWSAQSILKGFPDGTFHPSASISRAEFIAVVNRVFGFHATSKAEFGDVTREAWYHDALLAAREAGYFNGFPNNEAKPLQPITRQDAVVLLARAFKLQAVVGASDAAASFTDAGQLSADGKAAIRALGGVVGGYADGAFKPKGEITRAEAAALLSKMIGGYFGQAGSYKGSRISGHTVVNVPDVVLHDAAIAGNLYLTPGIGDGEVKLNHVAVTGETFVSGGGAHTVIVEGSAIPVMVVDRPDGIVHVRASDGTKIGRIKANHEAIVELGSDISVEQMTLSGRAELVLGKGAAVKTLIVQEDGVVIGGKPVSKGTYKVVDGVLAAAGEGAGTNGSGNNGNNGPVAPVINLVDARATTATKSLFVYLNDKRGQQILFGQQHATDEGLSLTGSGGTESEVNNSVGDYPAVFGWDTLSLEGKEKPGVAGNAEQSRANLINSVRTVHNLGGIVTLSAHMPNFVTGGSFNDTSGSVVTHILPGGDKNAEFNAFLDNIALFANNAKDDNGQLIPIVFRPFHEQNGGWFWWGAKTTSKFQYVELYRYTIEYLRDKKGVHNFLYAYSPNGSFGGDESTYLTTYPGDDYVDILGMDQYDSKDTPGTAGFLNGLVTDLKMISKLADSKGKIATFSEFGYSAGGMKTTGNGDLHWFTDVLHAIKSDPDAKRMAYMMTWANFGLGNNLFVPYHNAPNGLADHELLPDFIAYYNDAYTAFLREVGDTSSRMATAAKEQAAMHIASPTNNATVTEAETTIRARVLNVNTQSVTYSIQGSNDEIPMTLDNDGFYYSAAWSPPASLNGKTATVTVNVHLAGGGLLQQTINVFVKVNEIRMKTYEFETSDIADIQNNGTWPDTIGLTLGQEQLNANGALKLSVNGAQAADSWQEFKLELLHLSPSVTIADVKRVKLQAWIPLSAAGSNTEASIRAVVMLPPDWDTKYGMTTTQVKLSDLPSETIDGVTYAKYTPVIDLNDAAKSAAATGLAVSLVGGGLSGSFPIYLDDLSLYNTYAEAPQDPALVDDFESYQGSDDALGLKIIHAGGDATAVTLDSAHRSAGNYGMKLSYTLAGSGYAGVTKSLGGVDWSTFNRLQLWMTPDGLGQKLVIQLKVDGVSFEAYPSLAGTEPGLLSLHFNDFNVAPWDTGNAGKKITKTSLKNVQEMSIYVNAVNGTTLTSNLYFDEIKAINDGIGGVSTGGTDSGSSPEPAGILYGFENDAAGWAIEGNQASATAPEVTTDAASEGAQSLTSSFSLAGTRFELSKIGALDLSASSSISAKVKLSSGSAKVKLYIKTGSGWAWHDNGEQMTVDASGFATITLDLNGVADLDSVKSIGFEIVPEAGGSGTASIYADDIQLTAKP